MLAFVVSIFLGAAILLVCRTYALLPCHNRPNPSARKRAGNCTICIVLGSGGHTTEMLRMLKTLPPRFSPRRYLIADSDMGSRGKALSFEESRGSKLGIDYCIETIPRARRVHQSYLTTPLSFLHASLASVAVLVRARPHMIISNGPGTALPVLMLAFLPRIVGGASFGPRLIYVESWARVGRLSMTGKIAWYFVDRFLVQWEMDGLKGVEYVGRVV
ncbi:hypothetical protein PhCBS80983_g02791 [Powellomyces hirtus]|uniref:UDP-N-acetylglucosamine transferase subunit ALG14 n=1 Tax=Powellomyces hirtus TaxID=109895 RepID=A0A507E543_9FUNG|nr:hypothetical protein PhCBS80983_g02791 [Powellomyces hirtus]